MSITDEKYVSLVTYKRDGTPIPLPVWIVDLGDNTAGFTTWDDSWKAKRVRNNPAVTLQSCDSRGNVTEGSAIIEGTARIGSAADFTQIQGLIKTKYGFAVTIIKTLNSIRAALGKGGQSNSAMIIDLKV